MLNIRLPAEPERKFAEEVRLAHKSRSELARDAMALHLRIVGDAGSRPGGDWPPPRWMQLKCEH